MQEYVEDNPITFNDIPRVMSDILKKCDLLEQSIEILHEEIRQSNQKSPSEHIPMDVKEACEFLKIKKSTMYCYIQNGQIPVNKKGENTHFLRMILLNGLNLVVKLKKQSVQQKSIKYSVKDQVGGNSGKIRFHTIAHIKNIIM